MLLELELHVPLSQEVLDAEEDFGGVSGFGEKVGGAEFEGLLSRFAGAIGGEDQDGDVALDGAELSELFEDLVAVQAGHVEVEDD